MKCMILAAGYATRLYPLTKDFPKPLLEVKDKTIMNWLMEDIVKIDGLDEVIVVSNHRFADIFMDWKNKVKKNGLVESDVKITILDDGSTANENRLGAVRDIAYAIEQCHIKDDILVMAGDNLLDFSITGFVDFYWEKQATCIMRHFEDSLEKLQRTGVVEIDENSKVLSMQEKPKEPRSTWAVPPFYIYRKEDLNQILEGVASGEVNVDAPGGFIEWFCKGNTVYAYEMPGKRYDIGNLESLEWIRKNYKLGNI